MPLPGDESSERPKRVSGGVSPGPGPLSQPRARCKECMSSNFHARPSTSPVWAVFLGRVQGRRVATRIRHEDCCNADVVRPGNADGAKAGACAAHDPVDGDPATAGDGPGGADRGGDPEQRDARDGGGGPGRPRCRGDGAHRRRRADHDRADRRREAAGRRSGPRQSGRLRANLRLGHRVSRQRRRSQPSVRGPDRAGRRSLSRRHGQHGRTAGDALRPPSCPDLQLRTLRRGTGRG